MNDAITAMLVRALEEIAELPHEHDCDDGRTEPCPRAVARGALTAYQRAQKACDGCGAALGARYHGNVPSMGNLCVKCHQEWLGR